MTAAQVGINATAVRNLAERLELMGYDGNCQDEAERIVADLAADGWRPLIPPPPLHGPSSTEAGREAARRIWQSARAGKAGS